MTRNIVKAVRAESGVAEAAQVWSDHFEPRRGQRCDVAPPDALRFRPPVDEQQRRPSTSLMHERLAESADINMFDVEAGGVVSKLTAPRVYRE